MTAPSVVQSKIANNQAVGPGAYTLTMDSNITAGNVVIAGAVIYNASVTTENLLQSVTENTSTSLSRNSDGFFRWDPKKALSIFSAKTATGGGTAVAFTPGVNNSSTQATFFAIELSNDVLASGTWISNFATSNSENAATELVCGPTGTLPSGDKRLFAIVSNNNYNSTSDIGWQVPSGWTEVAKLSDGTSNKYTLQILTKTVTTTTSESVTTDSTVDSLYGRNGVIFAVIGSAGSTTKKVKVLGNAAAAGQTGITIEVFEAPSGSGNSLFTGDKIFAATNCEFDAVLNGDGQAEMYVTAPVQGDVTADQDVVVIGQKADETAGWQGPVAGVVVEV